MYKKINFYILTFALLLTSVFSSFAQNDPKADELLKKLSQKTANAKGINAKFESKLVNLKDGIDLTQEGSVQIKGEKYRLQLDRYLIISDGKTIWNFNEDDNEVNISDASEMEDEMNPSEIFTIYEKGFKSKYEGKKTENGETLEVVNLYPINPKEKPFHTIILYLSANDEIKKAVLKYKDGNQVTYTIKELKTSEEFASDYFTFVASKFPGVEVNDLR
jgi:outer membrane lipoprotein-sorting protein